MAVDNGSFRIAHISDLHCGGPHFVPNLLERAIGEINELRPNLVVCSGDLTTAGYKPEWLQAKAYLDRIECSAMVVVPGNHDARNVGYVHFEELVGERYWVRDVAGVRVVGADSSEPDLNEGQIGRERYEWIRESLAAPADLKVFALHHHLLPVPGTGRERSTVMDAGDLLEVLIRSGVNVVLSGHKHVPYVWRLETIYIANAGTVASLRLRGHTKPCYNVLEFEGDEVKISRRYPFGGQTVLAHFSLSTGHQYYRELEQLIQQPVEARSGGARE